MAQEIETWENEGGAVAVDDVTQERIWKRVDCILSAWLAGYLTTQETSELLFKEL